MLVPAARGFVPGVLRVAAPTVSAAPSVGYSAAASEGEGRDGY